MTPTSFEEFGLPAKLTHALTRIQFTTPTPIQAQAIPLALDGKDILGSAQTGTGKTGAFGIPLIAGLMEHEEAAALIMTPTRELAAQVAAALAPMIPVPNIQTALLIGGESMPRQLRQLQARPRLIVGTPGRINDHLERGSLKLNNVRYLVLDETDRMLDMGFGAQIERILKHVSSERQTLLFSATLPANIVKLSARYMRDPVRIAVGSTTTPLAKIKQEVVHVTDAEKYDKLKEQIDAREGSIIVFAKTKWGTQKLSNRLTKDGYHSDAIHGDLQQKRRDRVIRNFRDERFRVLVATDVAARGLDIPHIAHVINYDMPQVPEDYIHRLGRTARAGAEGEAISFVTSADGSKWRDIQRLIGDKTEKPLRDNFPRRDGSRKPFWKRNVKPYGKAEVAEPAEANETERTTQRKTFHKPAERRIDDRPRDARGFKGKPYGKVDFGKGTSARGEAQTPAAEPRYHAERKPGGRHFEKPFRTERTANDGSEGKGSFRQKFGDKPGANGFGKKHHRHAKHPNRKGRPHAA